MSTLAFVVERPPERARKVGRTFLRGFNWDWAWTLTFGGQVSHRRARDALKKWLTVLARDVLGTHFRTAWVIEGLRLGEMFHAHLLIEELSEGAVLDVRAAERAWRNVDRGTGYTRCNRYRRGVCDEHSFEDYMGKEAEWDMTIVCPRRSRCKRRHGCEFLSATWF